MDSNQRFSTAQKGRESARQSRAANQLRNPAPFSREGIRKRLEDGSEYDDVLITDDYTKLKDFALERGFITKEEAGKIASHKAGRVAALIAEGKGGMFAGREFRPDMSPEAALAKRQEIGAGYAAQAPVERQKDIELLGKMGYTPEDVAKFGTDRSGFIPSGVPIIGGNEVPIASQSFWQDPIRNLGISAYQGGVGLGATAEGMVAPARALATRFTGGDPTQFYAPNENPLVEAGTIFGSNAAESAAGFPARYAGMRIGGELGFKGGMALSGGNPLWGGVGAVAGGMLGQLGMGHAMETLNDAAMNLILGRENAARLQQRKQELSAAYPLAARVGEELPDLTMFGPSFKVKGFSGKAAAKGFKQAGLKGLQKGVVNSTEFAGDLAERGGESALNMVLAYKQSEDEKKLGMPGKSAWDILAEGALGAVMQGDTRFGRAIYGGMNRLTDPGMIQQAISRTAPGATAMPSSPAVDTGTPLRPGMRRFNLGGRIESGVDADGSPIIKGARYAIYDPETRKAQVYTDNEFALEGARTRKAAQSLQGTSTIFKRQPIIQYDDSVVGGQRQILGITRDAGVLVRDYTNDGKSTISAVPLSEIRNAKINKRINEVIENQGVRANSRPAPFMPESFTNFNPIAFPDAVTLTTDSEPIPARVVERIGGKTDASYIVALPDGTHIRAHESQINVDKFTGGEHIIRGAMKDSDFPRSLADLAPKRGGLKGLVRIGEGADAPEVELTPAQRKDYQAIATTYKADIDAIKREPDATRRGQMLDIVNGKIANEYLATNPIPAPSGEFKEGDVIDVNLSQTQFGNKAQTAIVTDVNDYGYAVRLVDHPNVGTFTVQDANVVGRAVPSMAPRSGAKGLESLASGRISGRESAATSGEGVPAVTRGYSSRGLAATDVAGLSTTAKHVDYVELPANVQSAIQKRFKQALDNDEIQSGKTVEFVESAGDTQVHGQIHVHSLDNMTFQIVASTFPEGGGKLKEQNVSTYNVRYNPDTDMWDVYSVAPHIAERISESDEAAYMAISHLKNINISPLFETDTPSRKLTPEYWSKLSKIFLTMVDQRNKAAVQDTDKTPEHYVRVVDDVLYSLSNGHWVTPFNVNKQNYDRYFTDMWDDAPLDMNDPAQFARASDAGRYLWTVRNDQWRFQLGQERVNKHRKDLIVNLTEQVDETKKLTRPELALLLMEASKNTIKSKFDENKNLKYVLAGISENNENMPITIDQIDLDSFTSSLESGATPKAAFLNALIAKAEADASNRNVPFIGWKEYGPNDGPMLRSETQGTGWCVSDHTSTAVGYLQNGPFFVYYDNGQPTIAFGKQSGGTLEPPRGARPNQSVTANEARIAEQFMRENNLGEDFLIDRASILAARDIIDGNGTIDDVTTLSKSIDRFQRRTEPEEMSAEKVLEQLNGTAGVIPVYRSRTKDYSGLTPQLELLTELPAFKENFKKITSDGAVSGLTINAVSEIRVSSYLDTKALQDIYLKYIKDNKDFNNRIKITTSNWKDVNPDKTFGFPRLFITAEYFDNDFTWVEYSDIYILADKQSPLKLHGKGDYNIVVSDLDTTIDVVKVNDNNTNDLRLNVFAQNGREFNIKQSAGIEQSGQMPTLSLMMPNGGTANIDTFDIHDITLEGDFAKVVVSNSYTNQLGIHNNANGGYLDISDPNKLGQMRGLTGTANDYMPRISDFTGRLDGFAIHTEHNRGVYINKLRPDNFGRPLNLSIPPGSIINEMRVIANDNDNTRTPIVVTQNFDGIEVTEFTSATNDGYYPVTYDFQGKAPAIVNLNPNTNISIDKEKAFIKVNLTDDENRLKGHPTTIINKAVNATTNVEVNITPLDYDSDLTVNNPQLSTPFIHVLSDGPQTTVDIFSEQQPDLWARYTKQVSNGEPVFTLQINGQTIDGQKLTTLLDSLENQKQGQLYPGIANAIKARLLSFAYNTAYMSLPHDMTKVGEWSIFDFPHNYNFSVKDGAKVLTTTQLNTLDQLAYYMHFGDVMLEVGGQHEPGSINKSNKEALYGASLLSAGQNRALDIFPTKVPDSTREQTNKFFGITNDSLRQETVSLFDDDAHADVVNNLPDPFDTDGEPPIMLDWTGHPEVDDDGTAYQEFADEDVTPSGEPKKVSNGYKLKGSFRISVPTSQLRRYREERMKIAATYAPDSEAYKRAMRKLEKEYKTLIQSTTSQVLSMVNKLATEQRPNVTGYQQKETTATRTGYAIKGEDRNFLNLPKPAEGAPDNRLGKYKLMFNALGEDYQVDAFRVSNRAQLKTVLQKQYKYDAGNAGRVAEVVDRFARAWAMDKLQQTGFRPTEIVEITGKLNENLTELGAYTNPSSDMLFQHFPGQTKRETALVAQYMREFYEERFAAFGVLDEAYAFSKKFRGAIFRTAKTKDDAIFNVIVGFASRDETTGIHEIAHALFRGMGHRFQKEIAEAFGINSAVLRSDKWQGRIPIWVEEKFAAAFEGSLRAGLAPRAKDVLDPSRPRQQDPTLGQLWDEIGEFLTGARNATVAKQIASGEIPEWGKDDKGTRWLAKFNPADRLYAKFELELRDGSFVQVETTQPEAGAPVRVRDTDSGKVSTIDVTDILRYGGRVPNGFNSATLDTLSNWLRSYYTMTEQNIRTTLPDMIADYSGGDVELGQLRAEATNLQRVAFQEVMDEPRSPLLSSLSRIDSVKSGLKSLLTNNRLDIGNNGTVKNAYDRYGKPSNSFRLLRDIYKFDGNTAAAYYAQTETPEFKKWSENLPLIEAMHSIQVSPDIDMNKMSPEERANYRRYEAGTELANLASDIMRDGADDNDVDKFIDLADQYYRGEGRSQKEIRKAVEDIVDANDDENVQRLMSFESSLRQELATSPDFESARDIVSTTSAYRDAAHMPRTGKGFVTVSFPAMDSSNLIRSKNGVVLTSGITSFDGNRQGGEYIKFKNPQVVNLEGQGIDQQKLDRIIANATKAKRDGVVLLNLRHSNTVNSALHNVAVPITRYPTKSIAAVPGVDLGTYFSGGGTLEASVYESVFPKMAVEYNAEIASVYRANHGDHVQVKDVQEVDPTSLKDVQWFHASPVCKNFSDANPNAIETILDKKTGKAVVDAIDHSRPPIVTIENVAKYRESESFHAILDALRRNGYEFDYGVYKTSKYGGGTSRQRLIVRAVRGFRLPPVIQPNHEYRTWYESIKDIINTLPISELVPNQQRKLEASGIDVRAMKTPVLFTQNTYHPIGITADKVFPSFTTSGGTYRILMPGGTVRAVTPVALRRMMGLPDAYLLPESDTLARKILANGVPAELSQLIMAPLADAYARDRMTRLVNQEMQRRDTGEEAAYQEIDEADQPTMVIMRGLPGSGKSTAAKKLGGNIFSTDDQIVSMNNGVYKFDPSTIKEAHARNLQSVITAMNTNRPNQVIVDNTNMQQWEYSPYVEAAKKAGYNVKFVEFDPSNLTDAELKQLAKRNTHNVPEAVIKQMKSRWESRDTSDEAAYQESNIGKTTSDKAMFAYVAQTANISESDVQKLIDDGTLPKPINGQYDYVTARAVQARVSVAIATGKDGKLNWDNAVKFVPIIRDLNKKQIPFDPSGALETPELVHWLKTRKGHLFPMPNVRGQQITEDRMVRTFLNTKVFPDDYIIGGDRSGLMYDQQILTALEIYTNMRHNGYAVEFIKGVLNPDADQRTLQGGVGIKEFYDLLNEGREKPITQDMIMNWRNKGNYIPAMLNNPAHGIGKIFTPDHLLIAEKIADLIDSGVSPSVTKGQLKARLLEDPEYVEAFTRIVTHPWYQSTSTTTIESIKEAKPIMRMADVIAAIAKEVAPNKFNVANYQALERSGNIPKGLKPSDGTMRRQYNDDYVKLAVMALNPKYRGKTAEFRKQDPEYAKLWNKIDAAVKESESGSEEAAYQEIDDLFPSQRRTVETYDMPGAPSHVERIRPKQLPPRNAWFWGAIDLYNDITRLPLSGDLAFQNLQGGIIGLSNPLVGLKAFKAGLQGFAPNMQIEVNGKLYGSRKFGREQYHAAGEAMRRNPIYNLAKQAGLPLAMFEIDARLQEAREIELHNLKMTNPNATMKDVKIDLMDIDELGTVDEWYSKNRITRHLPMQGQFERFNSLTHDTLLLTQFDNWVKVLLSKGYQPNTAMFNNAIKDAARVLAVSVGDIKYSTNPEVDAAASRIAKIFFTAPRWLMSRALIDPFINQMVSNSSIFARLRELMGEDNPAFNLYNGDKEVAKLGQSMWLRIAGLEAMLAIMAWVFSNWYPDTEVNTDIQPGRIRIGDFQIDPMAGLIDHYKLAGRLAKAVFSVDPKDASRAEKEGIPQYMLAVKDISKELSYKASPGITFLQAITGMNDLKAQTDSFFTAPWEAKSMNVVGEPLFERSASAKIFYEMIRPRLRELFGDAVADDIPISNMMMDRIPMALPGFIDSFAQAKEYNRDPWVYALADTIPNFFGFKVDVMPTEARKDRAKQKNSFTAEDSPTLLRLLAEGRGSEAFTGTVKSSPPQGNVQPW